MVVAHLSVSELEERYRLAPDPVAKSHFQVIWLLAKGHTKAEVAEVTALSPRWINKLVRRYDEQGPEGLGDRRHQNAGAKPLIGPDDLEALRARLKTPPEDGGLWTSQKVAAWMAERLGLEQVHVSRGWEALKRLEWSPQWPRPRHPRAAGVQESEAFKKSSPTCWPKKLTSTPPFRSRSGPRTSIGSA